MVKKGLKVGDVFEDCGRRYRVLSVNMDGTYVSSYIGDQGVDAGIPSEGGMGTKQDEKRNDLHEDNSQENKKLTKSGINRMKKEDLERLCGEQGIDAGTVEDMKKALIDCLGL